MNSFLRPPPIWLAFPLPAKPEHLNAMFTQRIQLVHDHLRMGSLFIEFFGAYYFFYQVEELDKSFLKSPIAKIILCDLCINF